MLSYSSASNDDRYGAPAQVTPHTIRVILADDHPVVREGISARLEKQPGITVVGVAADGRQLVQLVKQEQPDVVISDFSMPGMSGLDAIREIVQWNSTIRCILFSFREDKHLMTDAVNAGALGYLTKFAGMEEFLAAIRTVYQFLPYYCHVSANVLSRGALDYASAQDGDVPSFSAREREIIRLVCEEKSSTEIGKALCASPRTIENQKAQLMKKMNVCTTVGMVVYALSHSLYSLPSQFRQFRKDRN